MLMLHGTTGAVAESLLPMWAVELAKELIEPAEH
jgi:hypothetical protein